MGISHTPESIWNVHRFILHKVKRWKATHYITPSGYCFLKMFDARFVCFSPSIEMQMMILQVDSKWKWNRRRKKAKKNSSTYRKTKFEVIEMPEKGNIQIMGNFHNDYRSIFWIFSFVLNILFWNSGSNIKLKAVLQIRPQQQNSFNELILSFYQFGDFYFSVSLPTFAFGTKGDRKVMIVLLSVTQFNSNQLRNYYMGQRTILVNIFSFLQLRVYNLQFTVYVYNNPSIENKIFKYPGSDRNAAG